MALTLRYAVRSDRGLVRNNNEDSVYAGPRLLAIADGMGGHAGGEVASKIVIGAFEELDEDRPIADLIGTLRDRVDDANASLAHAVDENRQLEGMGTTLTAIRFAGSRIALVHVGDSRAYLLRGGQLSQITHDDTYVQSLVDSGKLTAEEASHHPRRSMILRAMDGSQVDPDISIREARKGDRYLLCSDGLSDVVTATTLLEALSSGDPQDCADRLIELALRGGGPDNVTCIVADVVDSAPGRPTCPSSAARSPTMTTAPTATGLACVPSGPDQPAAAQPPHLGATATAPAPVAGRLLRAAGGDRRGHHRLRLDPEAVLRRQGRQRSRRVPGRQRALRTVQPVLGGREQRPEAVAISPCRPEARSTTASPPTAAPTPRPSCPGCGTSRSRCAASSRARERVGQPRDQRHTDQAPVNREQEQSRHQDQRGQDERRQDQRRQNHAAADPVAAAQRGGHHDHPDPGRQLPMTSQLRTGRGIELGYVLASAFVVASAEAIVEITRDNKVTSHVATYAAGGAGHRADQPCRYPPVRPLGRSADAAVRPAAAGARAGDDPPPRPGSGPAGGRERDQVQRRGRGQPGGVGVPRA